MDGKYWIISSKYPVGIDNNDNHSAVKPVITNGATKVVSLLVFVVQRQRCAHYLFRVPESTWFPLSYDGVTIRAFFFI